MSTPNVIVGGASVSDPGFGPAVGGVGVGNVLPFTGSGPGTLPLLIVGIGSLIVGAVCTLMGRKSPVRKHDDRWSDLSHLAQQV